MPSPHPFAVLLALSFASLPAQVVARRVQPAPAPAISPQPVLGLGDAGRARSDLARTDPEAGAAILRGIEWLLGHQDKDGRWNADEFVAHDGEQPTGGAGNATQDVAVTGLALLVLAREGKAPAADPRREPLLRGIHWLAAQQQEKGLLGTAASHDFVYGHAIATFALCAATAATDSGEARTAAEKALGYLETHRNPFAVWRYQPRDNDNDSSVTTWALMALLAGQEVGLPAPERALASVATWFDQVTDPTGRAGYTRQGEPSSRNVRNASLFPPIHGEAMTAAALWCRRGLGQDADAVPAIPAGAKLLAKKPPVWEPAEGKVDYCYWLFGTEALRRIGGAEQAAWNTALVKALLEGQRKDGTATGSWDPIDPWGGDGGRLYATALAVLALQALYQN